MRVYRTFGPAAALLFAAAIYAQTPPASPPAGGPTTGGTTPAPKAPGAGGTTPAPKSPTIGGTTPGSGAKLVFPTDRPGTGSAGVSFPTQLFRTPDVARSLSLTDAQMTRLNAFTDQLQTRFRDQFDRLATLPERERADRTLQLNREFTAAWLAGADDVFDERQLARYQQLQNQFGGFTTLTDPEVQRQFELTAAQRARLNEALTWRDQQMRDIMRQAELDRARGLQMFNDFNRSAQDRMGQLLTAEQMRLWAQMTGEPFQFPPPFAMTPGGPVGQTGTPGAPGGAAGTPGPTTGGTVPPGGPTTGGPVPPKK